MAAKNPIEEAVKKLTSQMGRRPMKRPNSPTRADDITLHCRAHNAYEGRRVFGEFLPREIREARIAYDAMLFAVPEREVR
jgi:hypothetical protein